MAPKTDINLKFLREMAVMYLPVSQLQQRAQASRSELARIDLEMWRLDTKRQELDTEIQLISSALAPVRLLSFDVLSRIFLVYQEMYFEMMSSDQRVGCISTVRPSAEVEKCRRSGRVVFIHPQILFTQICYSWRITAFDTASLWNYLTWSLMWQNVPEQRSFVLGLIERSKQLPFDIQTGILGPERTESYMDSQDSIQGSNAVLELISPVCSRWRTLKLELPIAAFSLMIQMDRMQKPPLHRLRCIELGVLGSVNRLQINQPVLTFVDAPHLTEVSICTQDGVPFTSYSLLKLPWSQLTRLEFPDELAPDPEGLRQVFVACERLESAVLYIPCDEPALRAFDVDPVPPLTELSNLKSLSLLFSCFSGVYRLFDRISLPALKNLSLEQYNHGPQHTLLGASLVRMWERAPFSLESFRMVNLREISRDDLEFLVKKSMDEVTKFSIVDECLHVDSGWLAEQLTYEPEGYNILPKLVSLTLHLSFLDYESTDRILDAISSRWNPNDDMLDDGLEDWEIPLINPEPVAVCTLQTVDLRTIGGVTHKQAFDKFMKCKDEGLKVVQFTRTTLYDEHDGYASEEV